MPTDLMLAAGVVLLGLILAWARRLRPVGGVLLLVGLALVAVLGRRHLLEPTPFQRQVGSLPAPQASALDWVRQQLVPGETCLTDFGSSPLPGPRLSPARSRAFWETGRVDLLEPDVHFLIYEESRVSKRFKSGLDKFWTRPGPSFGPYQAVEILAIPRVGAVSQPPFRHSLTLPPGPFKPGELVELRLDLLNATNETRRLGWVEVRVEGESFPRLAGFNPLPAHTGEVVELVFVAPEKPGEHRVTVEMPRTASGKAVLLEEARIWVK